MKLVSRVLLAAFFVLSPRLRAETRPNTFSTAGFSAAAPHRSPVVNDNGSVSFAFRAPTAREVRLSVGESSARTLALSKEADGWWTGRFSGLPPGLHAYVFLVDGVTCIDPLNPRIKFGTVVYSSTLEIAGVPPSFDAVQDGVPQGVEHILRYRSSSQKRYQTLHVYLPAVYFQEPSRTFPVLYLRHGGGDDDHSWMQDGRAGVILDNLIAAQQAEPMVIVTTNGMTDGTWSHGSSPEGMKLLEDELIHDVLPLIETRYRVQADRDHRAIAGLSMGGGQAFVLGLRHPDTFAWIGQFSSGLLADKDLNLLQVAPALKNAGAVNASLRLLWIGCGSSDPRYNGHLNLMDTLKQLGVRAEFHESSGAHEWPVWRDQLRQFLPALFRGVSPHPTPISRWPAPNDNDRAYENLIFHGADLSSQSGASRRPALTASPVALLFVASAP
jgi:enterochelin esterase family protein